MVTVQGVLVKASLLAVFSGHPDQSTSHENTREYTKPRHAETNMTFFDHLKDSPPNWFGSSIIFATSSKLIPELSSQAPGASSWSLMMVTTSPSWRSRQVPKERLGAGLYFDCPAVTHALGGIGDGRRSVGLS